MERLIFRPLTGELLWNTVRLTVAVTALSAVIGTATAWCVERTDLPGRRWWAVLVVVPLAIPDFVVSFGWYSLWSWVHGFKGAVIVLTLAVYPLVYLPVAASLRSADPGQEEVARSLGNGRVRTFVRITLAQARGAILGGCLLVALVLLAEYGAFEILGYQTFTTEIFTEFNSMNGFAAACALSLVLVLLSLLVLAGEGLARGRGLVSRSGPLAQRKAPPHRLGPARWPVLAGFTLLATSALGVPVGASIYWMFSRTAPAITGGVSLLTAAVHTAGYGAVAAAITTIATLPVALLAVRHSGRVRQFLERSTYLVLAMPGIVIAFALTYFVEIYAHGIGYGTSALLIICYSIMFFPLALVGVKASLARAPVKLDEMARSLGLGQLAVLGRITLRLAGPGLMAAFCLVFIVGCYRTDRNLAPYPDRSANARHAILGVPDESLLRPGGSVRPGHDRGRGRAELPAQPVLRPVGEQTRMKNLVINGLCKAFGSQCVLTDLDLEVPAGSLTAILGPSGSGKTTLLRILAGFEQADAGTVRIGDAIVDGEGKHVAPERRRIGYVPQEGSLFPHLSVTANVGFGLPARQRSSRQIADLLEAVGLADLGRRYPHELSGGQQQRVALARALAIRPDVVLLDEPFASLDAHLRASIRTDVQQIFAAAGTTAVLVTHDQDEALAIADRVAVLRDGAIAQYSAPAELYSRPVDSGLARFVGDANLLDGLRRDGLVDTVLGQLPVDVAPDQRWHRRERRCQRPAAAGDGPHPARAHRCGAGDRVEEEGPGKVGRVIEAEYYGHDAVLRISLEHADGEPIVVRTTGDHQLPTGSLVVLRARGPVLTWPR